MSETYVALGTFKWIQLIIDSTICAKRTRRFLFFEQLRFCCLKDGGGYFRDCFFFEKKTESSWDVKKVFSMRFKDFYMIFCAKESWESILYQSKVFYPTFLKLKYYNLLQMLDNNLSCGICKSQTKG